MSDDTYYELTAAAGKQIEFVRVYRDEQDREVIMRFTDGTEMSITMEVRSVTSAVHYRTGVSYPEQLTRYDEPPSETNQFN